MTVCIVGWAHTKFGKLEGEDTESLIKTVARSAMDDAGVSAADIDAVYLGHYNSGLSPQDFTSSLVLQADSGFRFKPVTRVENACATGSAATYQGINFIRARQGRLVLVIGVEKMTNLLPQVGSLPALLRHISSATAISRMRWHILLRKTTGMALLIPWRICRKISATTSAAMFRRKIQSLPHRSSGRIAP